MSQNNEKYKDYKPPPIPKDESKKYIPVAQIRKAQTGQVVRNGVLMSSGQRIQKIDIKGKPGGSSGGMDHAQDAKKGGG